MLKVCHMSQVILHTALLLLEKITDLMQFDIASARDNVT